jgi:hypothetical protein
MMKADREIYMPEEWGGVVPTHVFLDEAKRIVREGEKEGLILRVMGGTGIRLCTLEYADVALRLGRLGLKQQELTDLDFMAYRKQRNRMKGFFEALGYVKRRATLSSAASERQIYFHPQGWFFVDVFFDQLLVANHPLDFQGRLELDPLTIASTDFLLEKLQIVNLSDKDMKDALVLLLAHQVGERDQAGLFNAAYIARLLARDWGFWYTVTTNLRGVRDLLPTMEALSEEEEGIIASRIAELLAYIEREPKSLRWKMRARIGPRMRWYELVETAETVGGFGIWRLAEERRKVE